jgi:hypothetical protein
MTMTPPDLPVHVEPEPSEVDAGGQLHRHEPGLGPQPEAGGELLSLEQFLLSKAQP